MKSKKHLVVHCTVHTKPANAATSMQEKKMWWNSANSKPTTRTRTNKSKWKKKERQREIDREWKQRETDEKREKTCSVSENENEQYELQTVHFLMTCGDKTGVSGMACANKLGRSVGPAWGGVVGARSKQKESCQRKEKSCRNCRNSINIKSYYKRKEIW